MSKLGWIFTGFFLLPLSCLGVKLKSAVTGQKRKASNPFLVCAKPGVLCTPPPPAPLPFKGQLNDFDRHFFPAALLPPQNKAGKKILAQHIKNSSDTCKQGI